MTQLLLGHLQHKYIYSQQIKLHSQIYFLIHKNTFTNTNSANKNYVYKYIWKYTKYIYKYKYSQQRVLQKYLKIHENTFTNTNSANMPSTKMCVGDWRLRHPLVQSHDSACDKYTYNKSIHIPFHKCVHTYMKRFTWNTHCPIPWLSFNTSAHTNVYFNTSSHTNVCSQMCTNIFIDKQIWNTLSNSHENTWKVMERHLCPYTMIIVLITTKRCRA